MQNPDNKTLILGLGNVLLNDEGIGVKCIEVMSKEIWPENVSLLDGGTGGFVLLSLFQEYHQLIIIDATLSDDLPGTVKVLQPKFSSDFPKSLSTHELGLKDMIESAILLEKVPVIHLITVSISSNQDMDMLVSENIMESIPAVVLAVRKILDNHSI